MPSFTLQAATLATLPELYALNPDAVENARLLKTLRGKIERGEAHLSNTLILRTARGVEGTVFFGPAPHPYVFPDLRTDAPAEAITAFLRTLRRKLQGTSERQLVLDSARADVSTEAVLSAGWALDDSQVVYETDLRAFTWRGSPIRRYARWTPDGRTYRPR
ncbi:hypothetical protein [Deinococcus sp. KSM4-11]|uniref:hypothetical protein n=1 Tax=Deinococcus sp. KSM4-11 TaxID=2568654 RepID=UPI001454D2CE|nr:hypothetical protein [Deinococcus sp. KSM4-11]